MPRNKKAKAKQKKRQPRRTRGSHYQMPLDLSHLALGEGTYTLVKTNDPHHIKAVAGRVGRQIRIFLSQIQTPDDSKRDAPPPPTSASAKRKARHSSTTPPHAPKAAVVAPVIPTAAKPTETFDDQLSLPFQSEILTFMHDYRRTANLAYAETYHYLNQVKVHINRLQNMRVEEQHKGTVHQILYTLNTFFLHLCIDAINPAASGLSDENYDNYLTVIQEFINQFQEAEHTFNTTSEHKNGIQICFNYFNHYLSKFVNNNIREINFKRFLHGFFELHNPRCLLHTQVSIWNYQHCFFQLPTCSIAFSIEQAKKYLKSCDKLVRMIDGLSLDAVHLPNDFLPNDLASLSINMIPAQLHLALSRPEDIHGTLSRLSSLGDLVEICRNNFRNKSVSRDADNACIAHLLPETVLLLINNYMRENDVVLDLESFESFQAYVLQYASEVNSADRLKCFKSLITHIFSAASGCLPENIDTVFFATTFIYKACKIIEEKVTTPGLNVMLNEFKCFLFERLSQLTDLIVRGDKIHTSQLEDFLYLFVKASNFMDITLGQTSVDVSFTRLIHTQLNNLVRLLNPIMGARYEPTTTMHTMCSNLVVLPHRPFVPTQHEVITHYRYYAMFLTAFLLKLPRFNKDELLSMMPLVPARSAEELPVHLITAAFTQAEADLKRAYANHTNTNPEDLTPSLMLFQLRYRQQKSDKAQACAEAKEAESDTAEEKDPPPLPHPSAAPAPAETRVNRR